MTTQLLVQLSWCYLTILTVILSGCVVLNYQDHPFIKFLLEYVSVTIILWGILLESDGVVISGVVVSVMTNKYLTRHIDGG